MFLIKTVFWAKITLTLHKVELYYLSIGFTSNNKVSCENLKSKIVRRIWARRGEFNVGTCFIEKHLKTLNTSAIEGSWETNVDIKLKNIDLARNVFQYWCVNKLSAIVILRLVLWTTLFLLFWAVCRRCLGSLKL